MAATAEVVKGAARTAGTKGDARRERKAGRVPAVLYGAKKDSVSLSVDPKAIAKILHSASGHNTIFDLEVGNEKTKAMIVDWQYEPIKGSLLHIDLKRIAMDQVMRVKVPIHLTGEPAGVKTEGGVLDWVLREVEVECLPGDIPTAIDADISGLVFGTVLRVSELSNFGGKLKFITDPAQTVAHITHIKEEVVATPEAEATAAATPAEPEVIKKGKQETEEGAEAPAETKGKK